MIVDLYAGPGGWSEGARALGLTDIGIELDPSACATRAAAGHQTIRADVTAFPLGHLHGIDGLIASPPCQAFSTAGAGAGRALLDDLAADIHAGRWHATYPERVRHVLEVGRWATTLRPRWIAAEQVPPVLPLWEAYTRVLAGLGYSTWAGVLNAADYGVPQTRRRAILLASLDRHVAPAAATHAQGGAATLFGTLAPWVSMADALGWTGQDTPARTLCGDRSPRWLYPDRDGTHGRTVGRLHTNRDQRPDGTRQVVGCSAPAPALTAKAGGQWAFERPARTVAGDPRLSAPGRNDPDIPGSQYGENSVKLTITDALILQSFPPDYPVQGTKTKCFEQVGNAVPPLLATYALAAVTGSPYAQEAAARSGRDDRAQGHGSAEQAGRLAAASGGR